MGMNTCILQPRRLKSQLYYGQNSCPWYGHSIKLSMAAHLLLELPFFHLLIIIKYYQCQICEWRLGLWSWLTNAGRGWAIVGLRQIEEMVLKTDHCTMVYMFTTEWGTEPIGTCEALSLHLVMAEGSCQEGLGRFLEGENNSLQDKLGTDQLKVRSEINKSRVFPKRLEFSKVSSQGME